MEKNANILNPVIGFEYCYIEQVDHITESGNKITVGLFSGDWTRVYFTPGTASFKELPNPNDGGVSIMQNFEMQHPGEDVDDAAEWNSLCSRPVIVRLIYAGGNKIIGTTDNPVRLLISNDEVSALSFERESEAKALWEDT
jgi:hypothetical protein